jgi:hypothetical protein
MMRHLIHMDTLTSSISKVSGKQKRRMQIALDKMRMRHANIMRDFHYQIANFLVKRYDMWGERRHALARECMDATR